MKCMLQKTGATLRGAPVLFLGLIFFSLSSAFAANPSRFAEVQQLAQQGLAQLALHSLDQWQPATRDNVVEWEQWERERLHLLAAQARWPGLLQRIADLPQQVSTDFSNWVRSQAVRAYLAIGDGANARRTIRGLLWQDVSAQQKAQLRAQLIRAYLLEQRAGDATTALYRYTLDYGHADDAAWRLLRARVLLAGKRYAAVSELLANSDNVDERLLELLALARQGRLDTETLATERSSLAAQTLSPAQRYLLAQIQADVAHQQGDAVAEVAALEQALAVKADVPVTRRLADVDPQSLWRGYLALAERIANQQQLLMGAFEQWLEMATKRIVTDAVEGRAVLAFLQQDPRVRDAATREAAAREFVRSLSSDAHGFRLLRELYAARPADEVPQGVRYALFQLALDEGDVARAATLADGFQTPPVGIDSITWELRRARVYALAGRAEEAYAVMKELVLRADVVTHVDAFNQTGYSLQNIGAAALAADLYRDLLRLPLDAQQQRETRYWLADALAADKQYAEAARYYLQSASAAPAADAQWRDSARFNAARALQNGGLYSDAVVLYQQLLATTKDPSRQLLLQRRLQDSQRNERNRR